MDTTCVMKRYLFSEIKKSEKDALDGKSRIYIVPHIYKDVFLNFIPFLIQKGQLIFINIKNNKKKYIFQINYEIEIFCFLIIMIYYVSRIIVVLMANTSNNYH